MLGDRMLFAADDPRLGASCGSPTAPTPARVQDVRPGTASASPGSMTLAGNTLYFGAMNGLWKTDGTEAGTVSIRGGMAPSFITQPGNLLFFEATTFGTNAEPWVSDGTEAGTSTRRASTCRSS